MDLRTTYMGLELQNPVVASASPLSEKLDNFRRMEDAGAAAVVMFSLFEEQIKHENAAIEHLITSGAESYAESLSFFPEIEDYETGPDEYLNLLRRATEAVDIPVIGSLNGITNEGWVETARLMQEAGASGIELNAYYIPAKVDTDGRNVEQRYLDVLTAVKAAVSIPVAMKLSPFFSATANMARQFDEAGADALVLFNRFYQPDFDLDELEVHRTLELSDSRDLLLPLRWISILYGKVEADFALTSGVHSAHDILKAMMAGARVAMTAAALVTATAAGLWASEEEAVRRGAKDPGPVVVDEIAGQWLTYLVALPFLPVLTSTHLVVFTAAGFLLFRFFDVVKPWPIRACEKLPGGIGIVADDLAAGYFAAFALLIGWKIFV